jgi:hypothetical protein
MNGSFPFKCPTCSIFSNIPMSPQSAAHVVMLSLIVILQISPKFITVAISIPKHDASRLRALGTYYPLLLAHSFGAVGTVN